MVENYYITDWYLAFTVNGFFLKPLSENRKSFRSSVKPHAPFQANLLYFIFF